MTVPSVGQPVPDFSLAATGDKTISLSSLRGKQVVLYFYPKDDTPGCTIEGQDFTRLKPEFDKIDTVILGVSRDTVKSHEKFRCKFEFTFDLLSDKDQTLCNLFDVIKAKTMYGKPVTGVERSTFLIDREGILRQEWRKVSVPEHAQAVLEAARKLAS